MSLRNLFTSLRLRWTPEMVANAILNSDEIALPQNIQTLLGPLARRGRHWSSMSTSFDKAIGLNKQSKVAADLFPDVPVPVDMNDSTLVREYLDKLNKSLGICGSKAGHDFKADRRNREGRGHMPKSVPRGGRAYNKRFRLLKRMEDKFVAWTANSEKMDFKQIAKCRLATRITWEDFSADPNTAAFLAYMVARMNRRSTFTWGKQDRPFDKIADALLDNARREGNIQWWPVALIYTEQDVYGRLSTEQTGRLVGMWFGVLQDTARVLKETNEANNFDLVNLVVRRGNDSSTWNDAAGAFNKARDGWISAVYASGMASLLDVFAPGKALRLMAADVVAMHRSYGSGGLEPDTKVWGLLPKPWKVVLGEVACGRAQIENACRKARLVKDKGWVMPRPKSVVDTKPTPELAHGVVIGSPDLAMRLRKLGYFSGPSKGLKGTPTVEIDRDYSGDTLTVTEAAISSVAS